MQGTDGEWLDIESEDTLNEFVMGSTSFEEFQRGISNVGWEPAMIDPKIFEQHNHLAHGPMVMNCVEVNDGFGVGADNLSGLLTALDSDLLDQGSITTYTYETNHEPLETPMMGNPSLVMYDQAPESEARVGWECPKCGNCFAPHVSMCLSCADDAVPPMHASPADSGWLPTAAVFFTNSAALVSGTVPGVETQTTVDLGGTHYITSDTVVVQDNPYERDGVYFTSQSECLSGLSG